MRKSFDYIFPDLPSDIDTSLFREDLVPRHIAVIMDGNGRWAKKRALNRLNGHKAGIKAVRETIRTSSDLGVDWLTIYSFSTENWKRSDTEVTGLMDLFARTMLAELDELHEEGVIVRTIGDLSKLPSKTREAFLSAEEKTKNNDGLCLVVAVNYGARDEILRAVNSIAEKAASMEQPEKIDEDEFKKFLFTSDIPDPEVIIRTSGEMRLSNFLLWQAAYSEFVSTDVLWPDFDRYELLKCLLEYMSRDRRFGNAS